MKTCITCKIPKSLDNFHKKSSNKDGKNSVCKICAIAKVRKWQEDNAERYEATWKAGVENRDYLVRRAAKYGLTKLELVNLLEKANGVCNICKRPPTRWLVVDHCHSSSNVRGVLCEQCNQALGLFQDNTEWMQAAIKYLGA